MIGYHYGHWRVLVGALKAQHNTGFNSVSPTGCAHSGWGPPPGPGGSHHDVHTSPNIQLEEVLHWHVTVQAFWLSQSCDVPIGDT